MTEETKVSNEELAEQARLEITRCWGVMEGALDQLWKEGVIRSPEQGHMLEVARATIKRVVSSITLTVQTESQDE